MRIAVAEILQETNSFSSQVTELASFAQYGLYLGEETDYLLALEGAFKMEEISYIHA